MSFLPASSPHHSPCSGLYISLLNKKCSVFSPECWALCCKAYCCLKLSSEISDWFFRHVAHPWRASPIWATLHCAWGLTASLTLPPLLLFHIISNDWEMGVKNRLSWFVVYNKCLQVVSCHTDSASRRTPQKIRGNRSLLVKEIGKDTPLLSFTWDCESTAGRCVPVKWHWPSEHTPRGASFLPWFHGESLARCFQGSVSSTCISQSFSCLHLCIWEFVDISSISVLISWDFLAWP